MSRPAPPPDDNRLLAELLAAERTAPDPDALTRDRVWSRVSATVAVPLAPGDGGITTAAVSAGKAGLAVKLSVGAGLVAGGGALVAVQPWAEDAPRVQDHRESSPTQPSELATDAPPTGASPGQVPREIAEARVESPSEALANDAELRAEGALLARAAAAARRRDASALQEALVSHAARFPTGRLREEAAALDIRLRLMECRPATDALTAFVAHYPASLHRGGLEAAVRGAQHVCPPPKDR